MKIFQTSTSMIYSRISLCESYNLDINCILIYWKFSENIPKQSIKKVLFIVKYKHDNKKYFQMDFPCLFNEYKNNDFDN